MESWETGWEVGFPAYLIDSDNCVRFEQEISIFGTEEVDS